jgi:hypothetical protein
MVKKLLVSVSLFVMTVPSFAAYSEIDCSTDPVFSENSCNQCFDWWAKAQWDNLGLLSDLWSNTTDVQKIVYKEEQVDPEMVSLDSSNVSWVQIPGSDGFWEYTDEFNALYSDVEEWYVLDAWKSVNWLKSKLSYAYKLEKNTAPEWSNIGLLIYPITTHNILEDGEITIDNTEHNECVLFKSWEPTKEVIVTKKLPETGPAEFMLLIIVAMILGFGILKFRARA